MLLGNLTHVWFSRKGSRFGPMSTDPTPDRAEPKRRGSYPKGQAKRQEIVDAALVVFGRSGWNSGSMREIAKRVGLTPAGLMHHFKNKEELFTEVLRQRDAK